MAATRAAACCSGQVSVRTVVRIRTGTSINDVSIIIASMARYSFVLSSLVLIAMMAYVTCETPISGTVSTSSDDAEDDDDMASAPWDEESSAQSDGKEIPGTITAGGGPTGDPEVGGPPEMSAEEKQQEVRLLCRPLSCEAITKSGFAILFLTCFNFFHQEERQKKMTPLELMMEKGDWKGTAFLWLRSTRWL